MQIAVLVETDAGEWERVILEAPEPVVDVHETMLAALMNAVAPMSEKLFVAPDRVIAVMLNNAKDRLLKLREAIDLEDKDDDVPQDLEG